MDEVTDVAVKAKDASAIQSNDNCNNETSNIVNFDFSQREFLRLKLFYPVEQIQISILLVTWTKYQQYGSSF